MHSLGLFPFLRSAISFSRMQLSWVHMHSWEQQESFRAQLGAIFTTGQALSTPAALRWRGPAPIPAGQRDPACHGPRRPGGLHRREEYPNRAPPGHLRSWSPAGPGP